MKILIEEPRPGKTTDARATHEWFMRRSAEYRRDHSEIPILVVISRLHPADLRSVRQRR